MGEGFKRFKRQFLIETIIKSVLSGIALSLTVTAVLLILDGYEWISLLLAYILLIGVSSGILLGLALFFLLWRSDIKIARKIDRRYGLNEKIETMVAYRDDDGDIKELQRQDADSALNNETIKPEWKSIALTIVAFVLSIALLVGAIVVLQLKEDDPIDSPPDNTDPEPPPKEEFEATDHHKIALEALIREVEESNLQDSAKAPVIAELTLLLSKLDEIEYMEDMKTYVISSIKNVQGIINTVNTTYAFYIYAEKSSNAHLKNLAYDMYSLSVDATVAELNTICTALIEDKTKGEIISLKDELGALLKNSKMPSEDKLCMAMQEIFDVLLAISEDDTYSESYITTKLDSLLNTDTPKKIREILPTQRLNEDVKIHVVNELMRIFGLTEEDLKDESQGDDTVTDEPEGRPEQGDDGGFGTGETLFGSNDIVIDPKLEPEKDISEIYVEYGTIIGRYDGKITEMIASGEISEELAKILEKYFSVLTTPKGE